MYYFELPDKISEIHFGFFCVKDYAGTADMSKCTEAEISFKNNEWTIKAVCNGQTHVKTYQKVSPCNPVIRNKRIENKPS